MLIDIQIKDATPEELRDLFGKREYTTPDNHALLPMPVFDKLLKEYKEPKSKEIIEKTVNPPHEPTVPDEVKKPIPCDGCHPKPCSDCKFENERCKHRPYAKGDHICRFFIPAEAEQVEPQTTQKGNNGLRDLTFPDMTPEGLWRRTESHDHDDRMDALARAVILSDELPKEPLKKKQGGSHSKGNKYGIPSELRKTDKKRYDVLWARCNQHGIMYEEAVKRDGIKGGRTGRKATPKKSEHTTGITGQPQSEEKLSVTESRIDKPPSDIKKLPSSQYDCNKITMDKAPASETVTGIHVRQIRPDNGRQFFGIGMVVARERNGELIHVRNGGGKIHKIDAKCLEIVASPEKKAPEAESS